MGLLSVLARVAANLLAVTITLAVAGHLLLTKSKVRSVWLSANSAQCQTELWFLYYSVVWVSCFAIIVASGVYESFGGAQYLLVCGGLALPLLAQPFVAPWLTGEVNIPLTERRSFQANLWIAIFGFIANYFYTHYFYRVLGAEYTMPSSDLNGVPISMFFATHFYFTLYHTLANLVLRRISTGFTPTFARSIFSGAVVCAMSYVTALTETITISGFPCWRFDNWESAVLIGSGYYALYFVVSYPAFYHLGSSAAVYSTKQVIIEALATGMAVLILLDAVRLWLGVDFAMRALRPCKIDSSRACAPFDSC